MSCMRKCLGQHYGDQSVALGGVFLLENGKAKIHVMVNFNFQADRKCSTGSHTVHSFFYKNSVFFAEAEYS